MINKFNLEGFYTQSADPRKCRSYFFGKIEISDDGYFEGEVSNTDLIEIDNKIERILTGHIKTEKNLEKLFFIKLREKYDFANSIYILNKPSNGSFEGEYVGFWGSFSFVEKNLPKKNFLCIPYADLIKFPPTDYTKINIYKKQGY